MQLKEQLAEQEHVSLTIDIWSDRTMRGFIGITVHFFSGDELVSKNLAADRIRGLANFTQSIALLYSRFFYVLTLYF